MRAPSQTALLSHPNPFNPPIVNRQRRKHKNAKPCCKPKSKYIFIKCLRLSQVKSQWTKYHTRSSDSIKTSLDLQWPGWTVSSSEI